MAGKLRAHAPRIATRDTRAVPPPGKVADPFYSSPEWRALLARIIAIRGRHCQDLHHDPSKPRSGVRIYGDHIVELRDGGAPLDERNVTLKCGACHTRKTLSERARRMAVRF